jgi:ubiquitin carboxyl-terminal hydrolase 22/27/51
MSVVLQSLLHNPFLRAFYLSRGHPECRDDARKERCTACALDEIFTEFHATEKTEGYGAVMMLIRSWKSAEHLAGYQQQDAHEYMQFILNSLHSGESSSNGERGVDGNAAANSESQKREDVSDAKCTCIIHKTFYGKLQSTVTCAKCKNTTTAVDPFMDLSLDLRIQAKKRKLNGEAKDKDKAPTVGPEEGDDQMQLSECLRRFTSEEKLPATEYTCGKCKEAAAAATKQLNVRRLPPVLSIHLKVRHDPPPHRNH